MLGFESSALYGHMPNPLFGYTVIEAAEHNADCQTLTRLNAPQSSQQASRSAACRQGYPDGLKAVSDHAEALAPVAILLKG
jgi:hypothetical protein